MLNMNSFKAVVLVSRPHGRIFVSDTVGLVRVCILQHNRIRAIVTSHPFITHIEAMGGRLGVRWGAIDFPGVGCVAATWHMSTGH
jgi:hypothetical protein